MVKTLPLHQRLARLYLPFDNNISLSTGRDARSSELHRQAEIDENNRRRIYAWAYKKCSRDGCWPLLSAYRFRNQRHGNGSVVKFPRRKQQIMHADLPTPPEAA